MPCACAATAAPPGLDVTLLQDALEAANSSPGVVFLPAGTYLITAPLVITGSNVTLRGEGVSAFLGPPSLLCCPP